jgi:serine/threonine-protein kinase
MRVTRNLAAIATLCVCATSGHAQSPSAEALFRDGRTLIKQGKLDEGCDKLDASDKLESSVGTLLNLGDCRERQGKLASAWAAFRRAEALAKRTGGDRKRRDEAARRAAALEPRLAMLEVDVASPSDGQTVHRNRDVLEQGAWNTAVPVDPGSYAITSDAPGKQPWRRDIVVSGGRQQLTIPRLADVPAPPPAPPVAAQVQPAPVKRVVVPVVHREPGTWTSTRALAVTLGTLGLAAAGGGAYFSLHARDLEDQADRRCPTALCADPVAIRYNRDAETSARRANYFYAGAGAAAAVAVVLWIVGAPDSAPEIAPSIDNGAVTATYIGRF